MFQTINLESRLATPAFPQAAVLWDYLERMSGQNRMSHADWMAIAALHVECTEPATFDCRSRHWICNPLFRATHTGWISSERFMISSLLVFGREEDDEFFVQACALSGAQVARRINEDDMTIDALLPPSLRGEAETVDDAASSTGRIGRSTRAHFPTAVRLRHYLPGACLRQVP